MAHEQPRRSGGEIKSYFVSWGPGSKPSITKSYWLPGYTAAHAATPDDAIQQEFKSLASQIAILQARSKNLRALRKELNSDEG